MIHTPFNDRGLRGIGHGVSIVLDTGKSASIQWVKALKQLFILLRWKGWTINTHLLPVQYFPCNIFKDKNLASFGLFWLLVVSFISRSYLVPALRHWTLTKGISQKIVFQVESLLNRSYDNFSQREFTHGYIYSIY